MATSHTIKHGDTLPVLNVVLYRDEALTQVVDLTNATTVTLKVGTGTEDLLLDEEMTIDSAVDGEISYKFA